MVQVKWVRTYLDAENKCNILVNGNACGKSMQRKSDTVKKHVLRYHTDLYNQVTEKLSDEKSASYDIVLTELACYFATTSAPISHLSHPSFKKLLNRIPAFKNKVPGKKRVLDKIETLMLDTIGCHIDQISSNQLPYSITLDIATTKGMRQAFLGIVVFYIDTDMTLQRFALDLISLTERHTADYLYEVVKESLKEWDLRIEDVSGLVTDGAANMKAAFKHLYIEADNDADLQGQLQHFNDDSMAYSLVAEDDDDDSTNLDDNEQIDQVFERSDKDIDDLESEFGEDETGLFDSISKIRQHSLCAAHKLQLVLKDVFEKNGEMTSLKKRIMSTLNKFTSSHTAARLLKANTKKSVIVPVLTRFSYLALTYKRALELSDEINKICEDENWPKLQSNDLQTIRQVLALIEPFKEVTSKLEGDQIPTLSWLYPAIKSLIELLKNTEDNLLTIRQDLISSLERRFSEVITFESDTFDPKFVVATMVDPKTAFALDEDTSVLAGIIKRYGEIIQVTADYVDDNQQKEESPGLFSFGPKAKKRRSKGISMEQEFLSYFDSVRYGSKETAEFWIEKQKVYPRIFEMFLTTASVPATSGSVERMFSFLSMHTLRYKNGSKPGLIKKKVISTFNKTFIQSE